MDVEVNKRIRCSRDACPRAEIRADVEEFRALSGVCAVRVTIECAHGGVCRFEDEGRAEDERA